MGSGGGASSGFLPEQAGFESQVENIILNGLVFQKCQKILIEVLSIKFSPRHILIQIRLFYCL